MTAVGCGDGIAGVDRAVAAGRLIVGRRHHRQHVSFVAELEPEITAALAAAGLPVVDHRRVADARIPAHIPIAEPG